MPTYPYAARTNCDTYLIQLPPIPLPNGTAITVHDEDEYYGHCSVGSGNAAKFGPVHVGDYTAVAAAAVAKLKAPKPKKGKKNS